jgi:pimeloyl-ACP methyl ester carboxylesterase
MRRLGAATCSLCVLLATLALAPAHGSSDPSGAVAGVVQIGGGRGIFMECQGTGSPTVVLISGKGNGAHDGWSEALGRRDPVLRAQYDEVALGKGKTLRERANAVFPSVSKFTRVCAYSRPGTGLTETRGVSTPVAQPHPVEQDVADLHALLTAGGVAGPYVLVAHSYGGLIARLFASTYPDEVSGLVLEDVVNQYNKTTTSARRFANWDRLNSQSPDGRTEAVRIADAIGRVEAAPPLRRMPVVQLVADKPWDPATIRLQEKTFGDIPTFAQWLRAQRLLARSVHATVIAKTRSGHNIEVYRPALVTSAIRRVVDAVREGRDSVPSFRLDRAARPG